VAFVSGGPSGRGAVIGATLVQSSRGEKRLFDFAKPGRAPRVLRGVKPLLYDELVPWYHLVDPWQDHADEAACYAKAFSGAGAKTLLELGAGAGHNAVHYKDRFTCTLTDLSEPMLARSRALNPECEHLVGDMRTLRMGRTFDAVFIHDAICYMATRDDLRAAMETAFVHTAPGGVALFAPDHFRETFQPGTEVEGKDEDDGSRGLRFMQWSWDPDPTDDTCVTDFAFLLREGTTTRALHDRHVEGIFSRAVWMELLREVGFGGIQLVPRPLDDGETFDQIFQCRRA